MPFPLLNLVHSATLAKRKLDRALGITPELETVVIQQSFDKIVEAARELVRAADAMRS